MVSQLVFAFDIAMRTVKSDANGFPQVFAIYAATLTRGGTGNLTATSPATLPHRLATGDRVRITGADLPQFNSNYGGEGALSTVTVTSPTAFTYVMAEAPSGARK